MDLGIKLNSTNPIVRKRAGMPLEQIAQYSNRLVENYDAAQDAEDMLSVYLDNIQTAPFEADREAASNIVSKYRDKIAERSVSGDYENQLRYIARDARAFKQEIAPVEANTAAWNDYVKNIQDRVSKGKISQEVAAKAINISADKYQGLDPKNLAGTMFRGIQPMDERNLGEEANEFIQGWKANGGEKLGYSYDENLGTFVSKDGVESVDEQEVYNAVRQYITANNADYIRERIMFDTYGVSEDAKKQYVDEFVETQNKSLEEAKDQIRQKQKENKTLTKQEQDFLNKEINPDNFNFNELYTEQYLDEFIAPAAKKASFIKTTFDVLNPKYFKTPQTLDPPTTGVDISLNIGGLEDVKYSPANVNGNRSIDNNTYSAMGRVVPSSTVGSKLISRDGTVMDDEKRTKINEYSTGLEKVSTIFDMSPEQVDSLNRKQTNTLYEDFPLDDDDNPKLKEYYEESLNKELDFLNKKMYIYDPLKQKSVPVENYQDAIKLIYDTDDMSKIREGIKTGKYGDLQLLNRNQTGYNSPFPETFVGNVNGKRVYVDMSTSSLSNNDERGKQRIAIKTAQHKLYNDVLAKGNYIEDYGEVEIPMGTQMGVVIVDKNGKYIKDATQTFKKSGVTDFGKLIINPNTNMVSMLVTEEEYNKAIEEAKKKNQ